MKKFEGKYVVCKRDDNGQAHVALFITDGRRNRLPAIYNDPCDAIDAIAQHMEWVADALRNCSFDGVEPTDAFGFFIADAEMDAEKTVTISIEGEHEPEVIYEGHYNHLIK